MSRSKRSATVASTMILVAILLSACEQPYSTPPAVTNTPIDTTSFFSTPIPDEPSSMTDVEKFTTQTALAALGTVQISTTPDGTEVTPLSTGQFITATSTPLVNLPPTATATLAVSNIVNTPIPSGPKPGTYILKNGEFPYCIARRFNVDPDQLLSASGLTSAQANSLSAGTVLTIPQSGSFPGDRSWHSHPATFTVGVTYDTNTVYGVACYYGDVDPSAIAQNNNISVDVTLTSGQTLNIP